MTEVFFYHLESSSPTGVLPSLLEKTLKRGWKALVKLPDREALDAMDEALWTYRDESFLPHGTSGAAEPVLLTLGDEAENGAEALFLAPGSEMSAAEMKRFERCVLLFGHDEAPRARDAWKSYKDEGFAVTYWKQGPDGRWEKAA
ncbi:DNA polymerase III subunit chi [Parvularcula sp. ZS-1/3]|uniref:DNA polymerase III subunit chi n=1 Tax=Parvularcula mediterranea TaxID=2732508 RepID=A0A7Y3W647_9PROT|nr:DNA polymerase III subunit chi [Parvularcula mediterranea]NNU17319.1 DNA polymerase III subunit chi [Parvularcula mediterranea]